MLVIGFHVTGVHAQLQSTSSLDRVVTHVDLVNLSEPSVRCRMLFLVVWFVTCTTVVEDSLTTSKHHTSSVHTAHVWSNAHMSPVLWPCSHSLCNASDHLHYNVAR